MTHKAYYGDFRTDYGKTPKQLQLKFVLLDDARSFCTKLILINSRNSGALTSPFN